MEFYVYQKILLNPVVSAFPFNIHATRSPINFLLSVSFFDRIRVHWFWLDCQQANKCKSECKINEIIDNFAFIFFLLTTQQSPFLPFFIHCSSSTFPFLSFFAFILSHRMGIESKIQSRTEQKWGYAYWRAFNILFTILIFALKHIKYNTMNTFLE